MDPPTRPAAAARRMVSATVSGASPYPFSRSPLTGSSVAPASADTCCIIVPRSTVVSGLPNENAMPALVVANASKPKCASMRADPTSQGLGMMKAPPRECSARKHSALSACVNMTNHLHLEGYRLPYFHTSSMDLIEHDDQKIGPRKRRRRRP